MTVSEEKLNELRKEADWLINLLNKIASVRSVGWQPIEAAPKDGSTFIALEDDEVYKMKFNGKEIVLDNPDCGYHKEYQVDFGYDYIKPNPTHWIQFPPTI